MPEKFVVPRFSSEAEEAQWWDSHQDLIAEKFEQAAAAGELGRGRAAQMARERTTGGASPTITIRLPEADLERARKLAATRGLRYQTYLKMLIHESLDREERRAD
jgi:predicted DNA binding CopG/RHH family protein